MTDRADNWINAIPATITAAAGYSLVQVCELNDPAISEVRQRVTGAYLLEELNGQLYVRIAAGSSIYDPTAIEEAKPKLTRAGVTAAEKLAMKVVLTGSPTAAQVAAATRGIIRVLIYQNFAEAE